jgi:hypothetical protein
MDFGKVLGEIRKWVPIVEALRGMFADPEDALVAIRKWEMERRAANDRRIQAIKDRDEG